MKPVLVYSSLVMEEEMVQFDYFIANFRFFTFKLEINLFLTSFKVGCSQKFNVVDLLQLEPDVTQSY